MAYVVIGAMCVGSINFVDKQKNETLKSTEQVVGMEVEKGEEVGYFKVIMCIGSHHWRFFHLSTEEARLCSCFHSIVFSLMKI